MGNAILRKTTTGQQRVRNIKHLQNGQSIRNRSIKYLTPLTPIALLDGSDFSNSPPTAIWIDRTGNGYDFTPFNFSYTAQSGSDGNGGVAFDGINDYCTIGNISELNVSSPIAVETTFIVDSLTDENQVIVGNFNNAGYGISIGWFRLPENLHKIVGAVNIGGAYKAVRSNEQIISGVQYVVKMVYDGNTLKLYVNGVLQNEILSVSGPIYMSDSVMMIGANPNGYIPEIEYFSGVIKEVCFYNINPGNPEVIEKRVNI